MAATSFAAALSAMRRWWSATFASKFDAEARSASTNVSCALVFPFLLLGLPATNAIDNNAWEANAQQRISTGSVLLLIFDCFLMLIFFTVHRKQELAACRAVTYWHEGK